MTRKELNLAIFEGVAKSILWQPRLETWIAHHLAKGTIPARFQGLDPLGIYDALCCSIRYEASAGIAWRYDSDDVVITEERRGDRHFFTTTTPSGSITTVERDVIWEGEVVTQVVTRRIEKYPVETPEDLRVVTDLIERTQYAADPQAFQQAAGRVGERAEPTVFLNSSGFTQLIKDWCGLAETFYLLADYPAAVEAYLEACERRDDRQIEAALQLPCRIFNLGDHATNEFTPPPILKKYLLPHWQRISEKLHRHGRFVHSHWDGHAKAILPYLPDTGLDSVEALTPAPMGDITLEEIKAAVGDKMVCLDLIPAIHFLPSYTTQEVLDFTRKVIDMFAPHLVLGISDEISQIGEIEKVEAITELVDSICGLAD
jgi:hypothetical protein